MAANPYNPLDQMDEQGNLIPGGLTGGGGGGGFDLGGLVGKYGLGALAGGLQGAGLISSLVGRSKARRRAKQEAENAKLEVDNQASTAKTGVGNQVREDLGAAEARAAGTGMYQSTAMDAIRRAIRQGGQKQTSAIDLAADRQKNGVQDRLTEFLRPGYSSEIAGGASGLVRSLGVLFPNRGAGGAGGNVMAGDSAGIDPTDQPGGDPALNRESFQNQGDAGGGGTAGAAYDAANDPERIYRARLVALRGGRRGNTGGDGGLG